MNYQKLVEFFEVKKKAANLLLEMDFEQAPVLEALVVLGMAKHACDKGLITIKERNTLENMVNDFCDSIM